MKDIGKNEKRNKQNVKADSVRTVITISLDIV